MSSATPSSDFGVAFVCHPYHRGGVTRWMIDAATEFRRRGTPVWFVAPEPRRPFPSGARRPPMTSLIREVDTRLQPCIVAPAVGVEFELGTVAYRASVYQNAISRGIPPGTPCIVSDDPSVWSGAATVAASHPLVGVLHGDDEAYYTLAHRHRASLSRCIAVSARIADTARHRADLREVPVIPCGIPLPAVVSPERVDGTAKLIWIGRMEEEFKRVSDLPSIADALRARGIDFSLEIIGDGSAEAALRSAISARGLDDRVHLLGWRDAQDIWQRLCASDVLLLPSNREGMPVVMMEALAAGCAVVASRVSGVEDAAAMPEAEGVLFAHSVGDVERAADLVSHALRTSLATRRESCRRFAEQVFSIESCVDRYAQLLAGLHDSPVHAPAPRGPGALVTAGLSFPLALARAARRSTRKRKHG